MGKEETDLLLEKASKCHAGLEPFVSSCVRVRRAERDADAAAATAATRSAARAF
eukprot:NODE_1426_length_877_cov_146.836957_g1179_i0.p5 GENE.NODE_1426_length_877_cov_146.836957_g1179_i0~~NODE_1426_length_877_cov_146.836957_g1179_i0.p5  ORF type:complete len:63 (+),score=18.05 NODE_1426_length_877_cov_146.836957_g1179_i0:29-190(+)